ncbi:hypothetical protein BJ508DRAFT_126339 [Ascobolus immersus RN42]|uniref:Uncharacterized protein n=1 Tax=Ascobolus immersus RN42 TaxID=1160509 RepID=A0A3N4I3B6_ASCIM|nr:hypothetical protein BJ508DRAFT_126339 [Ascobolus immersus RN42]
MKCYFFVTKLQLPSSPSHPVTPRLAHKPSLCYWTAVIMVSLLFSSVRQDFGPKPVQSSCRLGPLSHPHFFGPCLLLVGCVLPNSLWSGLPHLSTLTFLPSPPLFFPSPDCFLCRPSQRVPPVSRQSSPVARKKSLGKEGGSSLFSSSYPGKGYDATTTTTFPPSLLNKVEQKIPPLQRYTRFVFRISVRSASPFFYLPRFQESIFLHLFRPDSRPATSRCFRCNFLLRLNVLSW